MISRTKNLLTLEGKKKKEKKKIAPSPFSPVEVKIKPVLMTSPFQRCTVDRTMHPNSFYPASSLGR
jgi:hypothetical protein